MIKTEKIKRIENSREVIVRELVYTTVDTMIVEEAKEYNGVKHYLSIPFNWEGFGKYSESDTAYMLSTFEFDIEDIIKSYLDEFVAQRDIYESSFYSEDGEFILEYKVARWN